MDGYISANKSTILQKPTEQVYVNPNYEYGDNLSLISGINITVGSNQTQRGAYLYFLNEVDIPTGYELGYFSLNANSTTTIVLDIGFVLQLRQVLLTYSMANGSGLSNVQMTLDYSTDGVNYTNIKTEAFTGSVATLISDANAYNILAKFVRIRLLLQPASSTTSAINLTKIRLVL